MLPLSKPDLSALIEDNTLFEQEDEIRLRISELVKNSQFTEASALVSEYPNPLFRPGLKKEIIDLQCDKIKAEADNFFYLNQISKIHHLLHGLNDNELEDNVRYSLVADPNYKRQKDFAHALINDIKNDQIRDNAEINYIMYLLSKGSVLDAILEASRIVLETKQEFALFVIIKDLVLYRDIEIVEALLPQIQNRLYLQSINYQLIKFYLPTDPLKSLAIIETIDSPRHKHAFLIEFKHDLGTTVLPESIKQEASRQADSLLQSFVGKSLQ